MIRLRFFFTIVYFVVVIPLASGRLIEFSFEAQTDFGKSLFLHGFHEFYGVQKIKLAPIEYPEWSLRTDSDFFSMTEVTLKIQSDRPEDQVIEVKKDYPFLAQQVPYGLHEFKNWGATSQRLGRSLTIYRPLRMKASRPKVLFYFHDGQNLFLQTTTAPESYALETWFPKLVGKFPKWDIIVVGIGNTRDRMREYLPPFIQGPEGDGTGDDYQQFVEEKVLNFIEKEVLQLVPAKRFIAGASLGGLISLFMAANSREIWDGVLAQSPSLQFEGAMKLVENFPKSSRVYLDSGTIGPTADNYDSVYFARDSLLQQGFIYGKSLWHQAGSSQRHRESDWAKRLPWAFDFLLRY